MESIFNNIKNFIVTKVNEELKKFEDDTTLLPNITNDDVVFGTVDISKNTRKIVVAIIPESQTDTEDDISDYCQESTFTVSFLFRGDKYNDLIKKMCRYACAYRNAILAYPSLNGTVQSAQIGAREFYPNCGTTDQTMTAVEITTTITTITEV